MSDSSEQTVETETANASPMIPDKDDQIARKRGRHAQRPIDIPFAGWWEITKHVWIKFFEDSVMLVAAGVAFYVLLALFPALLAIVSLYGFIANPNTISTHLSLLNDLLPSSGLELMQQQLDALVSQNRSTLSYGFIVGLSLAFWTSNSGMKALFEAMNIAYMEKEKRSFLHFNALSALFTLSAIALAILFLFLVGIVPVVLAYTHIGEWDGILLKMIRWGMIILTIGGGISCIYRYGPSRERAKWRWLSVGAFLATSAWIAASLGYSFYLANFANYSATYGSLGAIIGFMMWLWLSAIIIILGAQLNAQTEYYIYTDSTVGPQRPLGKRGAIAADGFHT